MADLSKFKDLYLSEADDQLLKLNEKMLVLEKKYQTAEAGGLLDEMMRASHTIKGSSATMGYVKTAFLTHVLEDIFDGARNKAIELNPETINLIFKALDKLEKTLETIRTADKELDMDDLARELKDATGVDTVGTGKSQKDAPPAEKPEKGEKAGSQAARKKTEVKAEDQEITAVSRIDYIKVPVERLDALMDLVEELLIDKMRIEQMVQKVPQLKEVSNHLSFLVSSIQYNVMQARLVPVEQVFARFPRMIRDLATKQGKDVDFVISGSEIELDRTIVDKLGEPLVHLLRNAVDHGINKRGRIKLKAVRESDYAVISVENDNNGIDFQAVKRAAVRHGIVGEKEIESYNEGQIYNLLFHPRLSTREQVTEISGRGVGLSVVKNFADALGGRVVVENLDQGVRFSLELPLTLAIINSLLVDVKGDIYAVPFTSIDRSVSIFPQDIKKMADNEVAVIDGLDVPLLRIDRLFGKAPADRAETEILAVLIRKGRDVIGIVVDNLINEQEIIVKPLSSILRGIKGFSGSTILGDGRTVLILDVLGLLKAIKNN